MRSSLQFPSPHHPVRAVGRTLLMLAFLPCGGCSSGPDHEAAQRDAVEAASHTTVGDARSAWIRITPEGLRSMPRALASTEALTVDLSRVRQGDFSVCPAGDCALRITLQDVVIAPHGADRLSVSVSARATTSSVPVRYMQTWPCAFSSTPECSVRVDTAAQPPADIAVEAGLTLRIDPQTGLLASRLDRPRIVRGLDGGDVAVSGRNVCGQIWCGAANLVGATGWLVEQANDSFAAMVATESSSLSCLTCSAGCPGGSNCDRGLCRMPSGDCAPVPLAAETVVAAFDRNAETRISVALADDVAIRRGGVEIGLRIAALPSRLHPCAPHVEAPRAVALPPSVLDGDDVGSHVRVALGERTLERVLWALHQGGLGCLDIGGEDVPALSAAALRMLLPSSRRLEPLGLDSPSISVRLLVPPSVEVRDDGTLYITAPRTRIDIEARVDDRTLRLAAAVIAVRAVARGAMRDGRLVIEAPRDGLETRIRDMWSAPLLGANDPELEATFGALTTLASGAVPEITPLDALPIPGRLVLARARGVGQDDQRALVVDLRLEPER